MSVVGHFVSPSHSPPTSLLQRLYIGRRTSKSLRDISPELLEGFGGDSRSCTPVANFAEPLSHGEYRWEAARRRTHFPGVFLEACFVHFEDPREFCPQNVVYKPIPK
jgi:hypothetical protein